MQALRTFFRTVFLSLQPVYYKDVLNAPMRFSWKYFLALNFFLALLLILPFTILLLRFNPADVLYPAIDIFPEELVITIDEEGIAINQDLPYAVPLPEEFRLEEAGIVNLVVFDREEGNVMERLRSYGTFAIVTDEVVYFRDAQGMQAIRIPEADEPIVVSRPFLTERADAFVSHPFIRSRAYIPVFVLVGSVLAFLFLFLRHTVVLALFSVVVWLLARFALSRNDMTYGKTFQVGLHSITLILFADLLLALFGIPFFRGWVYFFAFVAWTVYIISLTHPSTTLEGLGGTRGGNGDAGDASSGTRRNAPVKKRVSTGVKKRPPAKKAARKKA